jgi:hypothetical protein
MAWKRGTEQTPKPGQVSAFHVPFIVQSISLIDAADPTKGHRVTCLAASDRINSGRIRIRASAWKFRKQGAPILYEHGMDSRIGKQPLGRWEKFSVQEGVGLTAEGRLDHFPATDPRAAIVEDIKARRITDVSVGHSPAKLGISGEGEMQFLDVQDTTLCEISFVSVGMDEEATHDLMAASALGFTWSEDNGGKPPSTGGNLMDRKLLIQLLNLSGAGLKEDANDAEVTLALQKLTQSATLGSKAETLLAALGLDASATAETVKTKVAEIRNPAGFVPKADYDKLAGETKTQAIDNLIAQHKNIPGNMTEFAKMLLADGHEKDAPGRKKFETWVASLPSISTRQLTGPGGGTPPARQQQSEDVMDEITELDAEWCQLLGYFRDERLKDGKVLKGVEKMAQAADMTSADALSVMFGQPVPETAMDREMRSQRKAMEARAAR